MGEGNNIILDTIKSERRSAIGSSIHHFFWCCVLLVDIVVAICGGLQPSETSFWLGACFTSCVALFGMWLYLLIQDFITLRKCHQAKHLYQQAQKEGGSAEQALLKAREILQ